MTESLATLPDTGEGSARSLSLSVCHGPKTNVATVARPTSPTNHPPRARQQHDTKRSKSIVPLKRLEWLDSSDGEDATAAA